MLCIGHRGAKGHEPENTLLSIRKAIELGADWIEIDAYTIEDELLVIHGPRLETSTNGNGLVVEQSVSHLRSLDAGKGESVPFLHEVLDLIAKSKVGINIELKSRDTAEPLLALLNKYLINETLDYDRVLVSSFIHPELRKIKQLNERLKTGFNFVGIPIKLITTAVKCGAYSVHGCLEFMEGGFVEKAHARGLKVFVFTVNEPDDIQRMRDIGVDGIFTDFPDRVPKP